MGNYHDKHLPQISYIHNRHSSQEIFITVRYSCTAIARFSINSPIITIREAKEKQGEESI